MKAKCEGVLFHGGCHGCTQQKGQPNGVYFCKDRCQYFEADWSKPNMNNAPPSLADRVKEAMKTGTVAELGI